MSCDITEAQGKDCLLFDTEAACDTALLIQNADCASCSTTCDQWAIKSQRTDGKWWCFKNPNKMTGVVDYTDVVYSDAMET